MADLHLRRGLPDAMKRRFDDVVRQYLAYSERVFRQYSYNLLHGNDFDVLLYTCVFSA